GPVQRLTEHPLMGRAVIARPSMEGPQRRAFGRRPMMDKGSRLRAWALGSAGLLAVLAPEAASAQSPPPAGASALEEVVVTARRREERLQDVPVAVTALSGEALQRAS